MSERKKKIGSEQDKEFSCKWTETEGWRNEKVKVTQKEQEREIKRTAKGKWLMNKARNIKKGNKNKRKEKGKLVTKEIYRET